jgi:hypothetical protein
MFNFTQGISGFFGSIFSSTGSDPVTTASNPLDTIGSVTGDKSNDSSAHSSGWSSDHDALFPAWGTVNDLAASEASSLFPTQSVTTETWGSIDTSFSSSSSPFDF